MRSRQRSDRERWKSSGAWLEMRFSVEFRVLLPWKVPRAYDWPVVSNRNTDAVNFVTEPMIYCSKCERSGKKRKERAESRRGGSQEIDEVYHLMQFLIIRGRADRAIISATYAYLCVQRATLFRDENAEVRIKLGLLFPTLRHRERLFSLHAEVPERWSSRL